MNMNASFSTPDITPDELAARLEGATPVIAQYIETKASQPDALLFFRMGDFYEVFFDDAVKAAAALGLALTKRGKYQGEDIPMAGVPAHAAEAYIAKLIRAGFRVAVCDQLEDPAEAKKRGSKSVVKRGIVRIVTPGTLTEDSLLEAGGANRLVAISARAGVMALACVELSTGDVECLEVTPESLGSHLSALRPSETLVADRLLGDEAVYGLVKVLGGVIQPQAAALSDPAAGLTRLKRLYGVETLDGFGAFSPAEVSALGLIAAYIDVTQAGKLPVLKAPRRLGAQTFLAIDPSTRASLEIDRAQRGGREGSLIAAIDRTMTSGGSRLLSARLARPLIDPLAINARLDAVEWLIERRGLRQEVRHTLRGLPDMARALSRLGLGRGGPRDLKVIKDCLSHAGGLINLLQSADRDSSALDTHPAEIMAQITSLTASEAVEALNYRLGQALVDEPPLMARDGGFIRPNYNANLNAAINLRNDSRQVILQLEAQLQMETSLPLKIKYNGVLGYFIELSAKQAEGIATLPNAAHFIHRQTLANQVRYSTTELIDLDSRIQRAASDALTLELAIFEDLREEVRHLTHELQQMFDAVCALDVACAAAEWAEDHEATRPVIFDGPLFEAKGAKHPVVVQALRAEGKPFTPNDCCLDASGQAGARLSLVTGPNMAGKSTFLRQNAILIIMAQAGLYVPATSLKLGVVDRLFSRVGAGDDLAQGRSTFMMEMVETAAILSQATDRSFVILDEIGRGTATFDGLAIAWASAENLHETIQCRALFATHYHEMSKLEQLLSACENISLTAKEHNGDLIFLHEAKKGAADRSYGVQVAKLAGMPPRVVARARDILERLKSENATRLKLDDLPLFASLQPESVKNVAPQQQSEAEKALLALNPDDLSPREALEVIYRLRNLVKIDV
ncbi:DNA mismatch repair protein MutS [Asticcacaulis sp. ZE23SCel15]|uniref:DNA mismatch repair protein MutS n=1 Tax=Asticcacaulis sp. ZE23SCel15 TaxID=3059027 RepID=UPI00265DBE34|nr:DNA mismatch repair protein MutS [Asticcacaulis sp. ZE23SCel15]WKL58410.1 DNA mismatch repair protein MutS [Asticcacaulis sp. ZE23SCel15]